MNKQLKSLLVSATILGSVSFLNTPAVASVDNFNDFKNAIDASTTPNIDVSGDITVGSTIKPTGKTVTINGNNNTFIGSSNVLGFDVQNNTVLNINNATLKNFTASGWGTVIFNDGELNLENVTFDSNKNTQGSVDGAIANYSQNGATANANLLGKMIFTNNTGGKFGGAIYNAGKMLIDSQTQVAEFRHNYINRGGAIYNASNGELTLAGSNILFGGEDKDTDGNYAKYNGGAVYNDGVLTTTGGLTFKNNYAGEKGGAIFNYGELNFNSQDKDVVFAKNTARFGGAIQNDGKLNFNSDVLFGGDQASDGNSSTQNGGALYNTGEININSGLTFKNNSSAYYGGAIFNKGDIISNKVDGKTVSFISNTINTGRGGAIYNEGSLFFNGDYLFQSNTAGLGGAINNSGLMNLEGTYNFTGNSATSRGGAIANERGNLTLNGVKNNGTYSINFVGNSAGGQGGDAYGGAIYIAGTESNPAYLNVTGTKFENNIANTHGGAIHVDANVNFNIVDSLFKGNIADKNSTTYGWGGALGLYSDDKGATVNPNVRAYVENSIFEDNYAGCAGGAIPVGTTLTIVNSTFTGNHAGDAGGAISYNPKNYLLDRELKIVADGGDTVFSGNWVGAYNSVRTAENSEGLYIGNAVYSNSWTDENDSNVYLNAGRQGKIIFNDIVNASGQSRDDKYEKYTAHKRPDVNNPNIQLNQNITYSEFEPAGVTTDVITAPTDGTIIFNNKIRYANLVLHDGVLTFGQKNNLDGYIAPSDDFKYFSEGAKITLKGGTLDLINQNIESKDNGTFNPDKLNVIGNANLRLDLDLAGEGKIDFINSEIISNDNGTIGVGKLTIDKISFSEGTPTADDLGVKRVFQFVDKNSLGAGNTILSDNLKTVITSNAGYTLGLDQTVGADDSISVTKVLNAGGLPVAVSLGDTDGKTYIYNATDNEEITAAGGANPWNKGYSIWVEDDSSEGGHIVSKTASNRLQGKLLQINGNGKNVFTSDRIIGIEVGTTEDGTAQQLIVNDVKESDSTGGWKGFNSAIINNGGKITLDNSIFSNNESSDIVENGNITKAGNGGAVYNQSGVLDIKNTNFLNNSATKDGGAIYNSDVVNITATDANKVTFAGNSANGVANDIYNAGTLNLSADESSSIVFNGGISGGSTKGNINIGADQYLGNVIFNSTVANQIITLNNGSLQIGANATGANNNYFQNVDLTLNGGTFNTNNNYIDTISVDKLTIGNAAPQWTLDVDLSNSTADNILANSVVQDSGNNIKIGQLNIANTLAEGQNSATIKIIDKVVQADVVYKNVITSGYSYFIDSMTDADNTYLTISQNGESGGFAYEVIKDSNVPTSYTIGSSDEIVNSWIGGNNKLGGVRFEINGGVDGKALIGQNGISGIVVGTKNNNPQQLNITGVNSYSGFNTGITNNGGRVVVSSSEKYSTNFTSNSATGNGGVIQNNGGVVEIEAGTTFTNNVSAGKGGAIFNDTNSTLNFVTEKDTDKISFGGNSALGGGNDIYNDGIMNVSGNGSLVIGSGIAGSGKISSDSNISLNGDNSAFTGLYEQKTTADSADDANPTITVAENSTFFGGTSNIQKGSMIWNTANDLVDGAKLTIDGASLTVGENAQLTIKDDSSIENATSVTTNGTLNLAKDMTVGELLGNGKLSVSDSVLTFNNNSSLSNDLTFNSSNMTANISAKADNVLSTIAGANATNSNLKINLDGTNSSADVNVDGTNISELNFSNNVEYSGSITGNGNVTNSGDLKISGDQSGFDGIFKQTSGSTTVDKSENLFGGVKNIESGKLTINAGNIDYTGIILGNGVEFKQTITEADAVSNLDDNVLKFNGSNASASFVDGNINLSKIDNGNTNTISFDGSKVSLADTNYQGNTIYDFKDAELDLTNSAGTVKDYVFDNIQVDNTDLSFNINIVKKGAEEVGARGLETDTVTVNGNGNTQFNIGNLHISGEENGYRDEAYTTDKNVLDGATFNPNQNEMDVATTTWIYTVTQNTTNNSIQMTIKDYTDTDTLNKMNGKDGTRFFQFTDGDDRVYHIKQSLGDTKDGIFTVSSKNADKNVLSGLLDGTTTDEKGSFFNIAQGISTKLNIDNIIIQDANKNGDGSVVSNESKTSVTTVSNSIIQNNSATGNGGALYNGAKPDDDSFNMIVSNTKFTNNSAGGNGGAIYNAGNLKLENVTLDVGNDTAKNDIYQTADGSTTLVGTNNINSGFAGSGTITNTGNLILTGDNSQYTGEFKQDLSSAGVLVQGDDAKFFGGTSTFNDGNLFWYTKNSDLDTGKLIVNGGNLAIGDTNIEAKLTLGDGSSIANDATVTIFGNSELELSNGSKTDLNNSDNWLGKITLNGGELNLNDITNYQDSKLEANTGELNVNEGALIVANNSYIKQDVATNIKQNSTLQIDSTGNVSMSGNNSTWEGQVTMNGGDLTLNDFTQNGKFLGNKGNLYVESGKLTVGNDSVITNELHTELMPTATIDVTDNGIVNLDKDDLWYGTVSLNGGTLNYSNENMDSSVTQVTNGMFIGESGNLNILDGTIMDISVGSKIEEAVKVNLEENTTLIALGGTVKLDKDDIWNGRIAVIADGTLTTNGVEHSDANGATLQIGSPDSNDANVILDNKSKIYLTNENSTINGGNLSIQNDSLLYLGEFAGDITLNNLTMSNNSQLNILNNIIDESVIDSMDVNGTNHVAIDIVPRAKISDTFIINDLNGTNNGTLNISDFNFLGQAPVDRNIKLKVFDAENINNVTFTATDKKVFTPIGNYKLFPQGGGAYNLSLVDYNPQVFRGQVATMAAYNHQLLIDDMLTNHFILPNERLIDKAAQANKTASISPLFAPYQSTIEEGGLWTKTYVSFENLSMTNNLKVGNNVYGTLIGADFPMIKLKNGWKFIPTAYVGYNGGNQNFNGVDIIQNGGQGGFMGTFIKNNFIGSITAYGGGYFNEMNVAGNTDKTGNWFAGTATKLAYNIHATNHFIIQPTAFVSYNIFGKQSWGTDYGAMSMNSGTLNGINVAPGLNLIYARDTWSIYGTIQYMFNINDQVGGKAGNVKLPTTEMRHGYINYGIGFTKTWKERLNSYFQVNLRNGGRTGVGFQLGLNYFFDWGKSKKKTQAPTTKPVKKVIKSI